MDLIKSIAQPISDVDVPKGIVSGYLSSFNLKDSDTDIIKKGSFLKTIQENGPGGADRIRHLLDHNKYNSVAKPLKLEEDDFGCKYQSQAGRHTAGRDFLLMCEDQLIKEHSFRGYAEKQAYSEIDKANIITEIFMWEYSSMQAWGANQWTPMISVKSLKDAQETFELLVKAFKTGKYSDDTFIQLEPLYKELSEFFKTPADTNEDNRQSDLEKQTSELQLIETFKNITLHGINS
jgi:HK97 family phage prohead protease